ncbi:MAG: hypothetical protein ACR2ML_06500 [Solirubrobacteraceae bacterium]
MTQAAPTFVRWLWIWITVGALVVVVVVGFLIGIVSSLESIDDGLFEADEAVTGARADTDPLPTFIQDINKNLTSIDKSLKPIKGQAGQILFSLRSIQGSLTDVDSSLVNTSGSLRDTSGSLQDTSASLQDTSSSLVDTSGKLGNITGLLVDTSGTLQTISASLVSTSGTLGGVSGSLVDTSGILQRVSPSLVDVSRDLVSIRSNTSKIDTTLKAAQSRDSLGTNGIWRRVRFLNGGAFLRNGGRNDNDASLSGPNNNPNGLVAVEADAGNIIGGLIEVNKHLTSICRAPVLDLNLPPLVRPNPNC